MLRGLTLLLVALAGLCGQATANVEMPEYADGTDSQARYELGIGAAYSRLTDYPGSNENQHYLLPFPYITYQSDKLKLNRSEALGQLFAQGNWALNISLAAALPVNSDDNRRRQGMDDLMWITEIGPTLDYQAYQSTESAVTIRFPLRKAIATDLQHWQSTGWRFEPQIRWRQQLSNTIQLTTQLAALWSTAQYHQYLYGVTAEQAMQQRPQYSADSGFSGWRLSGGLSWRCKNWWFGGFVRYDNLQQAKFNASPLAERQHNISYGLAFAWIFKQGVIYED